MKYEFSYSMIYDFYQSYMKMSSGRTTLLNDTLPRAINDIVNSDGISGATAKRMHNYMRDVHLPILSTLAGVLKLLLTEMIAYQTDYVKYLDPAANACVKSEEFAKLKKDVTGLQSFATNLDGEIKLILKQAAQADYSPAGVGGYPGMQDIAESYGAIAEFVENLDNCVNYIETQWPTRVQNEFPDLLDNLNAFICENTGHGNMYITSYKPSYRTKRYYSVRAYDNAINTYITQNKEQIRAKATQIIKMDGARRSAEIQSEFEQQMKQNAKTIEFWGYVGDCCTEGIEIVLVAFGCPKPAVEIVVGTGRGAWNAWYQTQADAVKNYNGNGVIIEGDKLKEEVVIGTFKAGMNSIISVGTGAVFDKFKELEFIESMTKSDSILKKSFGRGCNVLLGTVEDRIEDTLTDYTDRVIDAGWRQYFEGNDYQGKSVLEELTDWETLEKNITDRGKAAKSLTKSTIKEIYSAKIKAEQKEIKTPEQLEETHGINRSIDAARHKMEETFISETLGTAVEEAVNTDNPDRLDAANNATAEMFADEEKRKKLGRKVFSSGAKAAAEDNLTQRREKELISYNRQYRRSETASRGLNFAVPTDKYGNPDYTDTGLLYQDKATGKEAEVTIEIKKNDHYNDCIERAEKEYGKDIHNKTFETPRGYRWVVKYDQTSRTSSGDEQITLQLVRK